VKHGFFVERDHGPPAEGAASFHTTRWTIVMKAAQSQAQAGPSALGELCRLYWYPLYIFARRRGHSADDAEDKEFVRLDAEEAEDRYQLEPVESLTAEKIFNARWAMTGPGRSAKSIFGSQ
jgi:hypothetical protein